MNDEENPQSPATAATCRTFIGDSNKVCMYHRALVLILAVILPISALFAGGSAKQTHLTVSSDRLFIPATVNNVATDALLDSAAEMSILNAAFAEKLNLRREGDTAIKGSGGQSKAQFASGVTIKAAGVTLTDLTVVVLDLTDLSNRLLHAKVDLILGREFFDAGRFEIDIAGATIRQLDRTLDPGGVRLLLTSARGVENFPVSVEGVPALAEFDLGNGSGVLIGKAFAGQHGMLRTGRVIDRQSGGGIGGELSRDIIMLQQLELGGVTFANVRAAVDPLDNAGKLNIGTGILRRFVLVVDYPEHSLWLRP